MFKVADLKLEINSLYGSNESLFWTMDQQASRGASYVFFFFSFFVVVYSVCRGCIYSRASILCVYVCTWLSVCLPFHLLIYWFILPFAWRERGEEREKKGERVKARERKREREERGEGHRRKGKEGAERRLIEIW